MTSRGVRDDILIAAEELILGNGVQAATTRAIARAAGCSEGSIYRHFPGKNALVVEVINASFPDFAEALTDLQKRVGKGSVQANLRTVAVQALGFYRAILPIASGILSDAGLLKEHRTSLKTAGAGPVRAPAEVAAYLRREQTLGRISAGASPDDCARMLLGTLFSQAFLEELSGHPRGEPDADVDLVAGVMATLWRALRPADEMLATA